MAAKKKKAKPKAKKKVAARKTVPASTSTSMSAPAPAPPAAPPGPIPPAMLKAIQAEIAANSKKQPGVVHPNEWSGFVWKKTDGTLAYEVREGTNAQGAAMTVPAGAVAQVHSHPPGFGFSLDGPDSLSLNRASSSPSAQRPGDVQRWAASDGIWRGWNIRYAYVFGPTQVNMYDLTQITGDPQDIHKFTTVLSGADVRWPLHAAYQPPVA